MRRLKIFGLALLLFIAILFLPIVLGLGLVAVVGMISWIISTAVNEESDD
jgi:hypothetical protein